MESIDHLDTATGDLFANLYTLFFSTINESVGPVVGADPPAEEEKDYGDTDTQRIKPLSYDEYKSMLDNIGIYWWGGQAMMYSGTILALYFVMGYAEKFLKEIYGFNLKSWLTRYKDFWKSFNLFYWDVLYKFFI